MTQQTASEPKIILHQIGRGPFAPSLTPFAIKLETYLRMAKLPYTNAHGKKASSKGKFPWIEYDGQEIPDTSFIIQFLNEKHHIDLNSHLSDKDRAIGRAFRKMAEEDLYWCTVSQRWVYDKSDFLNKAAGFPRFFLWLVKRNVKSELYEQGIGRHTEDQVNQIMEGDLKAISDFLDTKKFLFGDEPCETDCAIFGQLSQIRWQLLESKGETMVNEKFTNLRDYCDRMKEKFWSDWDECITKGDKNRKVKD